MPSNATKNRREPGQGSLDFGQLLFDLVGAIVTAIVRLAMFSGRVVYATLGITPPLEVMLLTGLGIWALIGAIAAWVFL
jgi:ABC-type branched-subunit amino acid transport system permease subunit